MQKKYLLRLSGFLCLLLTFLPSEGISQVSRQKFFYTKPAKVWEECLPLGNGRLGMMPDGGVIKEKEEKKPQKKNRKKKKPESNEKKENITLNDITLWSGSPQDANNYGAYK